MSISFRAMDVQNNHDGTFTAIFEGRELTAEEHDVLSRLFPYTPDQVHDLLNQNTFMDNILTSKELQMRDHEIPNKRKEIKKPNMA